MTKGVELPRADFAAMDGRLAEEQRELLKRATRGKRNGRGGPDEAAALKLLYYFSQNMIKDRHVQETIMDGCREVAAYVANTTALRQNAEPVAPVTPLTYFGGKANGRKNKKDERLTLVAAFNPPSSDDRPSDENLMTLEEMRQALTKKWTKNDLRDGISKGAPLARKDWLKSTEAVERRLIDYVLAKHGGESREAARSYVHASFPTYAWHDDARAPFLYPRSWK